MPRNNYFRFKQFTVWQDRTALKVCTEACILGAYADVSKAERILDIGAGTGVLSLMMAQRTQVAIDAVEIETSTYEQARGNVAQSDFSAQIRVHHSAIQVFESSFRYDLIVSNPPFYQQDLPSTNPARNVALHAQTLSLIDLISSILRLLSPSGRSVVLLPVPQMQQFVNEAKRRGLYACQLFDIQNFDRVPAFRQICTFGFEPTTDIPTQKLVIYDENRAYTPAFKALLSPYYLYL
jgi:tRNA1Val (adenine37-N6)-methyltransferase